MKRLGLLLLLAVAAQLRSGAETVMVNTRDDVDAAYINDERLIFASLVEEGIMAQFFDNGHIIFSAGLSAEDESVQVSRELGGRIALAGGAGFLMDVALGQPDLESNLPVTIGYCFLDLIEDEVIVEGVLALSEIPEEELLNPEEASLAMGTRLALTVLNHWQANF